MQISNSPILTLISFTRLLLAHVTIPCLCMYIIIFVLKNWSAWVPREDRFPEGDVNEILRVKRFGVGARNRFRGSGQGWGALSRPRPAPLPSLIWCRPPTRRALWALWRSQKVGGVNMNSERGCWADATAEVPQANKFQHCFVTIPICFMIRFDQPLSRYTLTKDRYLKAEASALPVGQSSSTCPEQVSRRQKRR